MTAEFEISTQQAPKGRSPELLDKKRRAVARNIIRIRASDHIPFKVRLADIKDHIESNNLDPKSFNIYAKTETEIAGVMPSSGTEALVQGVKGEANRFAEGVRQMMTNDPAQLQAIRERREAVERDVARAKEFYPMSTGVGQVAPYFLAPGSTIPRATLSGMLIGGGSYTPEGETRLENTAIGGTVGAFTNIAGRLLLKPFKKPRNENSSEQNRVIADLEKEGFIWLPGDKRGDGVSKQVEGALRSYPGTSSVIMRNERHNQKILNKLAAKSIGEKAEFLTPEVFIAAKSRITGKFNKIFDTDRVFNFKRPARLAKKGDLPKDKFARMREDNHPIQNEIADEIEEYMTLMKKENREDILRIPEIRQLQEAVENQVLTSQQYMVIKRRLYNKIEQEYTSKDGDRRLAITLGKVVKKVEEHVKKQLNVLEKRELDLANYQYGNYLSLVGKGQKDNRVVNEVTGNLRPKMLAAELTKRDMEGFRFGAKGRGKDELSRVGKYGKAFPDIGDTGTATRSAVLGTAIPMAGMAATTYMATGDPIKTATAAFSVPLAISGVGRTYLSPIIQKMLTSGVIDKAAAKALASRLPGGMLGVSQSNKEEPFAP